MISTRLFNKNMIQKHRWMRWCKIVFDHLIIHAAYCILSLVKSISYQNWWLASRSSVRRRSFFDLHTLPTDKHVCNFLNTWEHSCRWGCSTIPRAKLQWSHELTDLMHAVLFAVTIGHLRLNIGGAKTTLTIAHPYVSVFIRVVICTLQEVIILDSKKNECCTHKQHVSASSFHLSVYVYHVIRCASLYYCTAALKCADTWRRRQ